MVAVIVDNMGRFLLGKRSPHRASAPGYWVPISGCIENDENEVHRNVEEVTPMKILVKISLFILLAAPASAGDFIKIRKYGERPLFHSKQFGAFWSIGMVTFMDSGANDPLKALFKKSDSKELYDQEFLRIQNLGFNTLGGWSNTEFLKSRAPYSVVLFDDPDHPLNWPLKDINNKPPSLADSEAPCPIGDPYDPEYLSALKKYLDKYVTPLSKDERLLMYWMGAEFGLGDTNAIDFSKYIFSHYVNAKFAGWLEEKYKSIEGLKSNWLIDAKSFTDAAKRSLDSSKYQSDALEFSNLVIKDWLTLVVGEIRKRDPNHLIGSPKISAWDFKPFLETPMKLGHFKTFRGLFDLFSVDWYSGKPQHNETGLNQILSIARELGVPIIVAEWGLRQKMEGWSNSPGAKSLVSSQQERAQNYSSQILNIFKYPEFIGAHWFRWQDHITKTHQFNKGIIQVKDEKIVEYEELTQAMKKAHSKILNKISEVTKNN